MLKKLLLAMATLGIAATAMAAENPKPVAPARTVNSYTPAEEARAKKAATDAGYTSPVVATVQDGNFFMTASRGGITYQLTVTPTGQVYAGK